MPIQPFGFDRVFHFSTPDEDELPEKEVQSELAGELEARLERLTQEHRRELERARIDGFEAGLAEARRERDAAFLASADALNAGLDDLKREFAEVTAQIAQEAANVAYEAARMLAGHARAIDPVKAVDEALGRVFAQLPQGTGLVLKVHPELREDLDARLQQRHPHELENFRITVMEDPELVPGDARIDWAGGGLAVDAAARRKAVLGELEGLLGSDLEGS